MLIPIKIHLQVNLRLTQKSKSKKNNSREGFSINEINQLTKEIKIKKQQ